MSLSRKSRVPLPESGVTVRHSGEHPYVYKVDKAFRNAKGQPDNQRTLIGKLDQDSGLLIPNMRYYEIYGAAQVGLEPAYESVRSIGATFLMRRLLNDLGCAGILKEVLGPRRAELALTACAYMACRGNVMEHVLDFCEGYTLQEAPLSPQLASWLFASISRDERMAFFRSWVARQPTPQYLAYDVTSFSTYAQGISNAEWGYNRDGERLPQINLGCYVVQNSGLPVFYVTYPGSIVDKSHLPHMLAYNDELGIRDFGLVLDRGFCSTANVSYLKDTGLRFILGVELRHKTVRNAVASVRGDVTSLRYRIKQGIHARRVPGRYYGVAANLHIYYDPILAEEQRRDLLRRVEAQEEKLAQLEELTRREAKRYGAFLDLERQHDGSFTYERNYGRIDAASLNCGFFCLLTDQELDSEEVLNLYRRRELIESGFDELKNHVDMRRLKTHNDQTTDGKLFCAFVSLIAVCAINGRMGEYMAKHSVSKDAIIRELEKVKVITMVDGRRLMNPLTKRQRQLYGLVGISEEDVQAYVRESAG